ncbi:MAG: hypothetical protein IJV82_00900 [Oscillospiraceae bacterium]|nr:hypothetical protein [Oscillospiraceae bacterium]
MITMIAGALVFWFPFMLVFWVISLISPIKKKKTRGNTWWLILTLLFESLEYFALVFSVGCFSSREAIPALVLFAPLCLLFHWIKSICKRRWCSDVISAPQAGSNGAMTIRCHSCGGMNQIAPSAKPGQCKYCFAKLKLRNRT